MDNEQIDIIMRVAQPSDARALIGLAEQVGSETPYLTIDEQGLNLTVDEEVKIINSYLDSQTSLLMVLEADEQIIGIANVSTIDDNKQAHVAELGISIIEEYWGYGLATQLMEALMEFVAHTPLKVLTLEVVSENVRAIGLYEKFGFNIVGKLSKRIKADCTYYDSYIMEKVLE